MSSSFPPPSPRKQMQCVSAKNAAQAIPLEITEASILQMISFIHEQLTEQSISSAYFRLGIRNVQLSAKTVRTRFRDGARHNKWRKAVGSRNLYPSFLLLPPKRRPIPFLRVGVGETSTALRPGRISKQIAAIKSRQ